VHKLCANHHIKKDMILKTMDKAPNAFIWASPDFSEGEMTVEKFCIRFKTMDEAKDFEYGFNTGRDLAVSAITSKLTRFRFVSYLWDWVQLG